MTKIRAKKIWKNGRLIDWDDATVHVMSHALHYGTSWFEGIRCYHTQRGTAVFRLPEHVQRLFHSCKIYRTEIPFSAQEISHGIVETIRSNELRQCYVRPLVFRGSGSMGVNPLDSPVEVMLMVWEWGRYLGEEALEQGVDVCTSSWMRAAPNTFPSMAKAGGNYLSGGLIKMEAVTAGFSEGIALDVNGYVSEGSGENIFFVYQDKIWTPTLGSSVLPGITRDAVKILLRERGYTVLEEQIPREMLYIAEEMFLCGTAAEVTPIRSVDRITVGRGRRGPVTQQLQQDFFDYVEGRVDDRHGWLTPVYTEEAICTPVEQAEGV
ncbi:MAG: branched-chain amino acid transaminase [Acidobacteriota bacterium]